MQAYSQFSISQLEQELAELMRQYEVCKAKGLKLDMSRGKPNSRQLDLSDGLTATVGGDMGFGAENGQDCRNYGMMDGLREAKALFTEMLGVPVEQIIIGGNSSLNLMYDTIARAMLFGVPGSDKPWCKERRVKFICPTPGYDRHFAICQHFGIDMIAVDMTPAGPDMNRVSTLVRSDPAIKGIWCVPKYSNPTGYTCSRRTVERFAELRPAAQDFRIFWDNAYCVHGFRETDDELACLMDELKKEGEEDMAFIFASTSKVSYAGAGLAAVGASPANIDFLKKQMSFQTIGSNKVNQLMHARFFRDFDGIRAHMKKHAELVRPKFDLVLETLERELGGLGIADWTSPNGGYFISFNTPDNCAKRAVELCGEAGVVVTPAGSAYPYGIDPRDRNIRIAPTYPTMDELRQATELFCLCVRIAAVERFLTISV